jgi:hypothetical protein
MKYLIVDSSYSGKSAIHLAPEGGQKNALCGRKWLSTAYPVLLDKDNLFKFVHWSKVCILCRKKHMNLEGVNAE